MKDQKDGAKHKFKGGSKRDKDKDRSSYSGYSPKKTTKELKFTPLDSKSQYAQASYQTVKDDLISTITKNFDRGCKDVIECLELEATVLPTTPRLSRSTATDDAIRSLEDVEFGLSRVQTRLCFCGICEHI
jgi:hypothetical protein